MAAVAMAVLSAECAAQSVKVADCVRNAELDYWAAADVRFCRAAMNLVFSRAGVEVEHMPVGAEEISSHTNADVICSAFRTPKLLENYVFPYQIARNTSDTRRCGPSTWNSRLAPEP